MTGWLQLTPDQRRTAINQASIISGISAKAIEKDWWVTLVLKVLFELPMKDYFLFKGGTCLSKGYKLIQRFSEDIDISLDLEAIGETYTPSPSKRKVKELKKRGCTYTNEQIMPALRAELASLGVDETLVTVRVLPVPEDHPDTDPQTIFVDYQSLYPAHRYLPDNVKVEVSIRSLKEPCESVPIQSLLTEHFPNDAYKETPFSILCAHPLKTLLEKIFLLHEKFEYQLTQQPDQEPDLAERQSRHLGDVISLKSKGFADQLLANSNLYQQVVEHRRHWISFRGINYDTLYPATLSFVPPPTLLEKYRADYAVMREEMIYGDSSTFDELIAELTELNERIQHMEFACPNDQAVEAAEPNHK
jgi:hypothetical protein